MVKFEKRSAVVIGSNRGVTKEGYEHALGQYFGSSQLLSQKKKYERIINDWKKVDSS